MNTLRKGQNIVIQDNKNHVFVFRILEDTVCEDIISMMFARICECVPEATHCMDCMSATLERCAEVVTAAYQKQLTK